MIPKDLKFTQTHEWVRLDEPAGIVTVGITDYAVQQLGDIVFVELPGLGEATKAGEAFGVIESVKAAVELCSPIDGEVVEANQAVADNLDLLAKDAYGQGWMIKVKVADAAGMDNLMTPAEYDKHLRSQNSEH